MDKDFVIESFIEDCYSLIVIINTLLLVQSFTKFLKFMDYTGDYLYLINRSSILGDETLIFKSPALSSYLLFLSVSIAFHYHQLFLTNHIVSFIDESTILM